MSTSDPALVPACEQEYRQPAIRSVWWCRACEEERALQGECECGEQVYLGPAIIWAPTGGGDFSGSCCACGQERDEPHTWPECARGMQNTINGLYGELGRAQAADAREPTQGWVLVERAPVEQPLSHITPPAPSDNSGTDAAESAPK